MKKLLLLVMMLLPMVASAYDVEVDGIYYNLIHKAKSAEVTHGTINYEGNLIIPESFLYEGTEYTVTGIKGESADQTDLGAFGYCPNLISITIPRTITDIGNLAFKQCNKLSSVHITDLARWCEINDLSNPLNFAHHLYLNGEEIIDLVIPDGVKNIGSNAFSGGSSITSVVIPNSVTNIGSNAFSGCSSLNSVNIPNSVTSIGKAAFQNCSGLNSISLSNNITGLPSCVFEGCNSLLSIDIPSSVTYIDYKAFSGCKNIYSITIPDNVTSLGQSSFEGCSNLYSVTIGRSVAKIYLEAFSGCNRLEIVNILDLEAWCKIDIAGYNYNKTSYSPSTNPLYYAKRLYLNGEEIKELVIPNGVTEIRDYTFYNCTSFTSVTIPNNVTEIGLKAFSDCSGLTSVTIANGVIGGSAFSNCSNLISVTIDNGVTSINAYAFSKCKSLTTLILGSSLKTIYTKSFANCPELADVYCYAVNVPSMKNGYKLCTDAFDGSYIEHATLHVPEVSIESYKATEPWKNFKTIVAIPDEKSIATNKVGGDYWATFFSSVSNYQADVNTTVYTAIKDGNILNLVEVADRIIKAGEGVILKSTSSTATLTLTATAATDSYYSDNALAGVDEETAQATGTTYYVLSNETSKLGFYKYTGTLGANKAFIPVTDSNAPTFYDISDWTTGINSPYNDNREVNNGLIYNLNGQRVITPQKGLYIINGHKVIK